MESEIRSLSHSITLRNLDGRAKACSLSYSSRSPCSMYLTIPGEEDILESGFDVLDAFNKVRARLEPFGWRFLCAGARLNAHASGLVRQWSQGETTYLLQRGKPATAEDCVSIFDSAPAETVGTIDEQRVSVDRDKAEWSKLNSPPPSAIREAKSVRKGNFVCVVDSDIKPGVHVPSASILGVWKVDENGNIIGDFIPNPNYRRDRKDG